MTQPIKYANVADIYDSYVQTTLDIPFLLDQVKEGSSSVLDLMCGTGRISLPLIEAGAALTCVDKSPEMLAILEQKLGQRGLSATLHTDDICDLDLGQQFDRILLPFQSFSEIISSVRQQHALACIHQHLSPHGQFICSLHNPKIRLKTVDGRLKLKARPPMPNGSGSLMLWTMETYDPEDKVVHGLQFIETYDQRGILQSKRFIEIQFSVLEKETFESMLNDTGFNILAFYGDYSYGDFQSMTSPFMIWILGKKL
ncbi:methylase involved in ubiquinone menaquinone biosynthesis [Leptolyngbya sp. Heron Island J]|uniref:class I SAM-dependent methyltransferase n=1 Tax=Leptolyngbya sp. Heron Island J TaxID=1385935 RepID=UPI0003B97D5A|nr:class I SAM-dependent methyltransferase [Leptolyngbya sp. Heron Island J]ESA36833.1 methylase involved in ubiquinone menaquinone biosynthesis [Leptolyngbya sp. Heron Island J]